MALRRTRVPEIRKGDTVVVLSGKDAGKQGVVDKVLTNPAALQRVTSSGSAKKRGCIQSHSPHTFRGTAGHASRESRDSMSHHRVAFRTEVCRPGRRPLRMRLSVGSTRILW